MVLAKTYSNPSEMDSVQAEPTVESYFASFNAGDFEVTAALFVPDGELRPPFESAIVGPDAIAQYLKTEAEGMQAYPESLELRPIGEGGRQILVRGRVKALVFKVVVAWVFELTESEQIRSVEVNLLASMQELLSLRP